MDFRPFIESGDVRESVDNFCYATVEQCVPELRLRGTKLAPWWKFQEKAHRRFRRSDYPEDYDTFLQLRTEFKSMNSNKYHG